MVISFTIILGAIGYYVYKSKEDVCLIDKKTPYSRIQNDDDEIYKDLEDLFI